MLLPKSVCRVLDNLPSTFGPCDIPESSSELLFMGRDSHQPSGCLPAGGREWTPTGLLDSKSPVLLATLQFTMPVFQIQEYWSWGEVSLFSDTCFWKATLGSGHN